MRKSLGSKRNIMSEADRKTITHSFGAFEVTETTTAKDGGSAGNAGAIASKSFASKIFDTHEFGYRRITVERPPRLSAQITYEAILSLLVAPKPYTAVMSWMVDKFGFEIYTELAENETSIRNKIKADFKELKEKQIKDVLNDKIWLFQSELTDKAEKLLETIGTEPFNDYNVSAK